MKDIEVKKRGWVKNAAIAFLAVMVVLLFFSNDIMNRSLPEVAAQYTQSSTISARIRGSGTVTPASEPYEVFASEEQTYTISEVFVKDGDIIETGTVLVKLMNTSSKELEDAEEALRVAELELEKSIISATLLNPNYASENRAIQTAQDVLAAADNDLTKARTELSTAQNTLTSLSYNEAAYTQALAALEAAKITETARAAELSIAENELAVFISVNNLTELIKELSDLESALSSANSALNAADNALIKAKEALDKAIADLASNPTDSDLIAAHDSAQIAYNNAQTARTSAQASRNNAKDDLDDFRDDNKGFNDLIKRRDNLEKAKNDATVKHLEAESERIRLEADPTLATIEAAKERVSAAQESVSAAEEAKKAAQNTLSGLVEALAEQQRQDGVTSALSNIDIREANRKIDELREEIKELKEKGSLVEITAPVSGKITQLIAKPGNQTSTTSPLMQIEIIDRGYTLTIPVTPEQSARVRVGDSAEVDRGWWSWGEPLYAVLSGIRPDPQNPAGGRLLVFTVTGEDIESGSTLNVTLAQQSENYSIVVPKSAIRSDTNGDFVLIVETRSSPLRNRYIATRVDVTILASDDTHTAISGAGLTGWDFVITTSTHPIEPGMQVRLVDNP